MGTLPTSKAQSFKVRWTGSERFGLRRFPSANTPLNAATLTEFEKRVGSSKEYLLARAPEYSESAHREWESQLSLASAAPSRGGPPL